MRDKTEPATTVSLDKSRRPIVLLPRSFGTSVLPRYCAARDCVRPAEWREDGSGEWFCGRHTS